jgi:SAM-dependent methyltransferase/uncharacterized protein YbaR (Trm112 family)
MTNEFYARIEEIFRCPITGQGLHALPQAEVGRLNIRITRGELTHRDGKPVQAALQAGYRCEDGRYLYPVIDGIIVLLANLAVPLVPEPTGVIRAEKKLVQDFYDQVGWKRSDENPDLFVDAEKWEDVRPVVQEYATACHLRVKRYLKEQGRYFLDAGSGPIQYPEFLTYSEGYDYRICVDLSFLALAEAKKKLGDRGICVLGDLTDLPLRDGLIDGAISLHVIYHIPKDEQVTAIREIHRVLSPGSTAAIAYSWGPRAFLMIVSALPRRIWKGLRRLAWQVAHLLVLLARKLGLKETPPEGAPETPYIHFHRYGYFARRLKDCKLRLAVWRGVHSGWTRAHIHPPSGEGRLRRIYQFEERHPVLAGRLGQYPLFIIEK